jgi:nucleolin
MSRECPKAGEGGGGGGRGVEGAKVFVGGLSFNSTEDTVRAFFQSCGSIVNLRIPTNPETEKPRGFCHLEFSSVEEAEKAVADMNG